MEVPVPWCALAALALLAAPPALADTLQVGSAHALAIEGDVALSASEPGGFRVQAPAAGFGAVTANATGRLTVLTWTRYETPAGDPAALEQPVNETFTLAGQPVTFTASRRPFAMQGLLLGDGHARVEGGPTVGEGRPSVLAKPDYDASTPSWVEGVTVNFHAGWSVAGADPAAGTRTWPLPADPRLVLQGHVVLQASDGVVEFSDQDGRPRRYELGDSNEPAVAGAVGPVQSRRLVFDGRLEPSAFPLSGAWSVAAPGFGWHVQGTLGWRNATGEAEVDGRRHRFEDAAVQAALDADGVPEPRTDADVVGFSPDQYEFEGEVQDLRMDGRPVAAAPAPTLVPTPAASSAVSLAALLLLLLTKAGQAAAAHVAALFTRISAGRLLDHPLRRRILDAAAAEPGIYMRALHRRVGGAWGPFTFHLRLLEKAGHVRLVRDGRFAIVAAAGAGPVGVAHPVARAVLGALPSDGAAVDLATLASRLGRARSVVTYHVQRLVRRGLAERRPMPGGRIGVARAGPAAVAAAPEPGILGAHGASKAEPGPVHSL